MLTTQPKKKRAANRKNTCKLRKHFRQFDHTQAAIAHNTTKKKRNALQIEKKHLQIKKTLFFLHPNPVLLIKIYSLNYYWLKTFTFFFCNNSWKCQF